MKWIIDTYKGVGPIRFNTSRSEVRSKISEDPRVYAQSGAEEPHDTYEDSGLFVMYDKYSRFGAVEFMKPVDLIFDEKNLFEMGFTELKNYLSEFDENCSESEKDFISFKLGIALFAPNKAENPDTICESITIFRENYFYRKIGISDPEVFSCLLVQHGFVNGIVEEHKSYKTLAEAYSEIFQRNTESLILLWNSFPIQWNYTNDIPAFANNLIEIASAITTEPESGEKTFQFQSENSAFTWKLSWDGTYVTIHSDWDKLPNGYEKVLAQWDEITMLQLDFLWEWKFLLEQLARALEDAGAKIVGNADVILIEKLNEVRNEITRPGRFYRKETRELEF